LNQTELYQLCRRAGINVHPGTSREHLISYLEGELDDPQSTVNTTVYTHPIDRWRAAIITFLDEYWAKVHPQLKCYARNLNHPDETKRDRTPCFKCTDLQVMTCVQQNAHNEDRMRTYLPVVRT
jgi:hypothetical protein